MFKKSRVLGHMRWSGWMVAGMAVICALILFILHFVPSLGEHTYVPLSRLLSGLLGMAAGFVPLSCAELVIYTLVFFYILYFIVAVARGIYKRNGWAPFRWLYDLVLGLVCIAFLFFFLWGGNYFSVSLDEKLGLDVRDRPEAALEMTARMLLAQVNENAVKVKRNEEGHAVSEGFDAMAAASVEAIVRIQTKYPEIFGGAHIAPPKAVMMSYQLGFTGIMGIYIPLTGEANVNSYVTDAYMPATMMHEMAHRLGCATEDEANYVAYLAGMESDDPLLRYSSALLALNYCRSATGNGELQRELWEGLDPLVLEDIRHNSQVFEQFAGPVMATSTAINDSYIKVMGVEDGVRSYGRVVDLLIAGYVQKYGEVEAE